MSDTRKRINDYKDNRRQQASDKTKHKVGAKKKPYKLECRYIGPDRSDMNTFLFEMVYKREWYRIGRYKTEKDVDQALDQHKRNHFLTKQAPDNWEYRIVTT
jgi:outer membrane receptor for Fe3+-dicitrate